MSAEAAECLQEPRNIQEALNTPDKAKWQEA